MMIKRVLALLLVGWCAVMAGAAEAPIRTLLLSGKNNHDWKTTTPYLKKVLEDTGRFTVDVTEKPETMTPELLAKYDLVMDNWTNYPDRTRTWGTVAEQALFNFVKEGKGLALFHAAAATFPDWPEFGQFLGAAWVPRIPGRANYGSGHGARHTYKIEVINKTHPITQGLSDFYANDELWHRLKAVPGVTTLTQAFSALDKGGTGRNEPMTIIHDYGKGRVFFLVPGHDVTAMSNPAWRTLMLRGAEWAATGKVTFAPLGPWPTTPQMVPMPPARPAGKKAAPNAKKQGTKAKARGAKKKAAAARRPVAQPVNLPADAAALVKMMTDYKAAEGGVALEQLQQALERAAGGDAAKRADAAAKLAAALGSATLDGKKLLIRELGVFGTEKEVPALAGLLGDKELGEAALATIERIPAPEALEALRAGLDKASGRMLIGFINALGNRGDAAAVEAIARRLTDADPGVVAAAIDALGKIGGPEGLGALTQFVGNDREIARPLIASLGGAFLRAAARAEAQGNSEPVIRMYQGILERTQGRTEPEVAAIRRVSLAGLLRVQPEEAGARALEALKGDERALQLAAVEYLKTNKTAPATGEVAAVIETAKPEVQRMVLAALAARGDKTALPAALKAATSESESVRLAALAAVSRLGGAPEVAALAKLAAGKAKEDLAPIHASLVALRGAEINGAILEQMKPAPADVRQELIQALIDRDAKSAVPELTKLAGAEDATLSAGAVKALGALAGPEALPGMIELLGQTKDAGTRAKIESALVEISHRGEDPGAAARMVTAKLEGANGAAKATLLGVLGALGGAEALAAVKGQLNAPDTGVHAAAIRALSAWPDGAPAADLVKIAAAEQDPRMRVLALRGFGSLVGKAEGLSPAQKVELIKAAMQLPVAAEEKKALLGQLGRIPAGESLTIAVESLNDPALADEAALAAVQISEALLETNAPAALAALKVVAEKGKDEAVRSNARALLETGAPLPVHKGKNLAQGAKAVSTDGLKPDGQGRPARAAIDGNPATYWDEQDGQPLYSMKVTLAAPAAVSAIRITSYQQKSYAPKDFDIICDGKMVRTVRNAIYRDSVAEIAFPAVTCRVVELKITGYYGKSPAIRELEIYGPEK